MKRTKLSYGQKSLIIMDVKDFKELFFHINMVTHGLALLLHITGLTVLYLHKEQSNQRLALTQLSLVEILLVVTGFVLRPQDNAEKSYLSQNGLLVVTIIEETAILELTLTMYVLTTDQLMCFINPSQYNKRVTKTKLQVAILCSWIISIIISVIRAIIPEAEHKVSFFYLALGGCYVLLAVVTYTIVLYKQRPPNGEYAKRSSSGRDIDSPKQFLVPGIITVTFLFFYQIPLTVYRSAWITYEASPTWQIWQNADRKEVICRLFMVFGLVAHPLTYILFSKKYRNAIMTFCKKCCLCKKDEVERSDNTVELQSFDQL